MNRSRHRIVTAGLFVLLSGWCATSATAATLSDPIDIELRRLCDVVVRGIRKLPGDPTYSRIVVLPFQGVESDRPAQRVRQMLTDYLGAHCLPQIYGLVVVEADGLGLDDVAGAVDTTRADDVMVVVRGHVSRGPGDYSVTAEVVDLNTRSRAVSIIRLLPLEPTDTFSRARIEPRTPGEAALRSLAAPGWGQIYNGQVTKGVLFILAEAAAVGAAIGFVASDRYHRALYDQGIPATAHERDAAREDRFRATTALGIAGAVWLGSVLDAYLSGFRYVPEDAYRSRIQVAPMPIGGSLGGALRVQWSIP